LSFIHYFPNGQLNNLQEEPVAEQDLVAMGLLRTIGITKGQAFNPNKKNRALLKLSAEKAK